MDLTTLTPNARALWWYLTCHPNPDDVRSIAAKSGIPLSSIYKSAQRYPDAFTLTGSRLHRETATPPD